MGKFEDLVSYLDKAKISPGTYIMNTEESTPVIYKYVSSERVFTCLPEVGDGALRATQTVGSERPI